MFSFHYRINPSIKVIVINDAPVWECIVTVSSGEIVNSISGNDPVDILAAAIQSVIDNAMAPGQSVTISNCELCDAPAVILDSLSIGGDRRILISRCSH